MFRQLLDNTAGSESRCVVISGASGGIGRATAIAFAKKGYRVGLLARSVEGLDSARREVEAAGAQCTVVETDVADHKQVEAAAGHIEQTLGPIDVWVNNAMATVFCPFEQISPEDFERATQVTYLGAVWGTRAALLRMKQRDRGVIIQVGSALSYRSIPLQAPYCGAKSALRGFTDSLRSELIHDRSSVHLTMVHLSAFNTPQFDWGKTCMEKEPQPVPPIFQPEVAAEAIVWAAEHRRREVWVGLPAVKAILVNRFFPGLLDRLLARKAYSGQQSETDTALHRQNNLYQPVNLAYTSHGRFDEQAKPFSLQFWMSTHRWTVASAAVVLGALIRPLMRRKR